VPAPIVVYSDFNCPFCYALNEELHRLDIAERLSWRGVQHAPGLPAPLVAWNGELTEALEREVAAVRRLAPELPIEAPTGKPNTTRAIRAAALALGMDRRRGYVFKDSLYRAFWCRGADLSEFETLDRLAAEAGFTGLSFARLDRHEIAAPTSAWQSEWEQSGCRAVPALVRPDGTRLVGFHGRVRTVQFLQAEIGLGSAGGTPVTQEA